MSNIEQIGTLAYWDDLLWPWQHCPRCIHTRSRQAHQASEPRGYPVGWRGPHAAKLRADEEASRGVERNPASGRKREAGHLSGFCGGRVRRSQAPSASCSRFVLQSADRGVRPTDDLESLQCVHERVQGTRSDPTVQGYCEARTFYRVGSRSGELIATSQCNGPCIARETRTHSVRCRSACGMSSGRAESRPVPRLSAIGAPKKPMNSTVAGG